MQKPSLGWQSWSPPFPKWHGFPRWDYSPIKISRKISSPTSKKLFPPIKYWCSWYAYGWDINDQKINKTLAVIKKSQLPLTHILIDDGWTTWGDWHTPDLLRFADFIGLIKKIKSNGLQAGLWFAPFLGNSKSQLFAKHPDWFIQHHGRYLQGLKTLPIWEWFLPQQYLLNLELPIVKKYLTDFVDLAITEWGVTLLKLDFLYAPYFDPRHKSDHAPHNQVSWLLQYIKQNYPQVTIIACGAPFAPSINIADIVRVSKDTALPPNIPSFLNRFFYNHRVKMLINKLQSPNLPKNLLIDPDVRIFKLDSTLTQSIWKIVPEDVLGIGDNLCKLSEITLNNIKLWLSH